MDQADDELRDTIKNIWPLQAKKMLDLLVPKSQGKEFGGTSAPKI